MAGGAGQEPTCPLCFREKSDWMLQKGQDFLRPPRHGRRGALRVGGAALDPDTRSELV